MAYVDWPTLNRKMDWDSSIDREIKLETLEFGDGMVQRYAPGINNAVARFKVVYNNLSQADLATLRNFVAANRSGQTIKIQVLPEDPSGATYGYFVIVGSHISGDYAPTMTIDMVETFSDV